MKRLLLFTALLGFFALSGTAQTTDASALAKQANNPLASIKSISVHNIYTSSLSSSDGDMNTTWLRYAQPFGRVLVRASLPINTVDAGKIDKSGFGDFNIFGTYILTDPTAHNQWGVGPILTIPTATSSSLGGGKWQIGAAVAGYFAKSPILQAGLLATWQVSFAGKSHRSNIHIASLQPFFMWQLGKGIYLRSSAINVFDFENNHYLVPLGLGAGKIVKVNKLIFNLFAEPQFTVWHKGRGMPKKQFFVGINTQF